MTIHIVPVPDDLMDYADPIPLENAFTNILENSLKYKDSDAVDVTIRCEELPESVTITIDSNGPGVPEESVFKLFDVFYRSDPSRNDSHKGSGLGLAITAKTRQAVEKTRGVLSSNVLATASGDTMFVMANSFLNCIVVRLVLAFVLEYFIGLNGIYIACMIAPLSSVPVGYAYYRSGKWRRNLTKQHA